MLETKIYPAREPSRVEAGRTVGTERAPSLEDAPWASRHLDLPCIPQCRFDDGEAIAAFAMDEGCFCHPEDRAQALCLHHAMRANPNGNMILIQDFSEGEAFTAWLRQKGLVPSAT